MSIEEFLFMLFQCIQLQRLVLRCLCVWIHAHPGVMEVGKSTLIDVYYRFNISSMRIFYNEGACPEELNIRYRGNRHGMMALNTIRLKGLYRSIIQYTAINKIGGPTLPSLYSN